MYSTVVCFNDKWLNMRVIGFCALFVFFVGMGPVWGQTAVENYFPEGQIPQWWFEKTGMEQVGRQVALRRAEYLENRSLRGSRMRFRSQEFLDESFMLGLQVGLSLKSRVVHAAPLSEWRLQYAQSRPSAYLPHALPLIYKAPPVPDLMAWQEERPATPFEAFKKARSHPGGGDSLALQLKHGFSREKFLRDLMVSSPELVEHDWHALPDPPKVFRQADRVERNMSTRNLEHLFQGGSVARPERLERVEVPKRPWTFSGTEHIQFSQAYLKNWVRGGQQSVALLSDLRFSAVYKDENTQWENNLIHKVGFIDSDGSRSRINDDLFEINSKYGINASRKWYYSLLFNFKTQFFDGYQNNDVDKENPISAFMAPAYTSLAAGMDFKTKNFTLLLSPVTSRLTMVLDTAKIDQTRYSIEEDKKSIFLSGASFQNNFTLNIAQDIKLTSAMNVFYDYFAKEERVQAEWDLILDMRINVFLSTRITTNFRYYQSESSKLQARENLSVALRYQF